MGRGGGKDEPLTLKRTGKVWMQFGAEVILMFTWILYASTKLYNVQQKNSQSSIATQEIKIIGESGRSTCVSSHYP